MVTHSKSLVPHDKLQFPHSNLQITRAGQGYPNLLVNIPFHEVKPTTDTYNEVFFTFSGHFLLFLSRSYSFFCFQLIL